MPIRFALFARVAVSVLLFVALPGCGSEGCEPDPSGALACGSDAERAAAFQPQSDGPNETSLGGGWIAAGQPDETRLKEVVSLGATILTLRPADEDPYAEQALVEALGGTFIRYPVHTADYNDADFRTALWDLYDDQMATGRLVYLHCKSSNRVGASWALYQFERKGKSATDAYALGEKAGMTSASDTVKAILGL